MNSLKKWQLPLGLVLCAVIGVMTNFYPGKRASAFDDLTETQDLRGLERRISSLEQRLYSIESNINRLQQSVLSQRPPVSQPSVRDPEVSLLHGEFQKLLLRLDEIECGLVKIDERTSTSAAREARKSAGTKTTDPCRLNPANPLHLSSRP